MPPSLDSRCPCRFGSPDPHKCLAKVAQLTSKRYTKGSTDRMVLLNKAITHQKTVVQLTEAKSAARQGQSYGIQAFILIKLY